MGRAGYGRDAPVRRRPLPMELRRYFALLRARWLTLAAFAALAVVVVVVGSPSDPVYVARSTLYIGSRSISLDPGSNDLTGDRTFGLDRLINTFAVMIDSEVIAQRALDSVEGDPQLSADELVDATTVAAETDTQLLTIAVADADPILARDLANALARSFEDAVQTFEPGQVAAEGEIPTLPAYVFELARLPDRPEPSGTLQRVLAALVLGAALGTGVVVLRDYLDVSVRGPNEVEARLGIAVLGTMPDLGGALVSSSSVR